MPARMGFATFAGNGAGMGTATSVISIFMMVFMTALECLVAYIQAYVFTMLSSIFIGMSQEGEE